ncbi:hypothetical protein GCM10010515_57430 [Streptomyces fructofermentans]|uniref:Uncharacterized protein n=1 Tax=Streptomyces fructofermentans TaxID=152141 RepID=A0A918U1T8_9ACTN|nr:hypothetical protein GCM10010515_57430 [Streptomyces fructofermentans]
MSRLALTAPPSASSSNAPSESDVMAASPGGTTSASGRASMLVLSIMRRLGTLYGIAILDPEASGAVALEDLKGRAGQETGV